MNGKQFQIPVTVYPGVFPRELQVTFSISDGREINATVPLNSVRVEGDIDEQGVRGQMFVVVVDSLGEDLVLVSVPGEILGAPSRVRLSKRELQPA